LQNLIPKIIRELREHDQELLKIYQKLAEDLSQELLDEKLENDELRKQIAYLEGGE
jgi:hypothetical protein